MSDTQTPAEALPESVTVAPLSEQLRLEAAVVNSFAVENNKPALIARLELYAKMADQLEATLARAAGESKQFDKDALKAALRKTIADCFRETASKYPNDPDINGYWNNIADGFDDARRPGRE